MKKIFTLLTLVVALLFSATQTKASHVMGSDITWKCLGNDKFKVTITVYRDCNGIDLSSAPLGLVPKNCPGYGATTVASSKLPPRDITPICKKSCTKCSTGADPNASPPNPGSPPGSGPGCTESNGLGMEAHTFEIELDLSAYPPGCCEFIMSWEQCCRNGAITTGASGANFYVEATLNRCAKPCDNSPQFTNPPLAVYCVNQPQTFNMGVNDPDVDSKGNADSLVYKFADPMQASGSNIPYSPPYNKNEPLYYDGMGDPNGLWDPPSYKGFHLDPETGDLQFKPTKVQVTVFSIMIESWGKDSSGKPVLKSVTRRDMQIYVVACPNNKSPQLTGINGANVFTDHFCVGQEKCFTINSFDPDKQDSVTVTWNKGIPGSSFTVETNKRNPKGKFCWKPGADKVRTYPYTFVVNAADDACPVPGRTTKSFRIYVHPTPDVSPQAKALACGNVMFTAYSQTPGVSYIWTGDDGLYGTSSTVTKHYQDPGRYKYSVTVKKIYGNTSCENSDTGSIVIAPYINVRLPKDTIVCYNATIPKIAAKTNLGSYPIAPFNRYYYSWNTGLKGYGETNNSSVSNIKVTKDTLFSVQIYDSTDKCYNFDTIRVRMKKPPVPKLGPDIRACKKTLVPLDPKVTEKKSTFQWRSLVNGTWQVISTQKILTVTDSGRFEVIALDSLGCEGRDTIDVKFNPLVEVMPKTESACQGETKVISGGTGPAGSSWKWYDLYAGKKLVNVSKDYNFMFNNVGQRLYEVVASYTYDGVSCTDKDTIIINVYPKPTVKILKQVPAQCINAPTLNLGTGNFASPAGGFWTMIGKPGAVTANILNPSKAGYSNGVSDTLLYTYKNPTTGCESSIKTPVLIDTLPKIILIDTTICSTDPIITDLTTTLVKSITPEVTTGSKILWEGPGVYKSGAFYAMDPSVPGAVDRILTLTYTPATGGKCEGKQNVKVTVVPKADVKAGTYAPLCYDATTIAKTNLNGSPVSGVQGIGTWVVVSSTDGNPSPTVLTTDANGKPQFQAIEKPKTGKNTYTLVYKYSLKGKCERTDTTTIVVNDKPNVGLNPVARMCLTGPAVKLVGTVGGTPVTGGTYQAESPQDEYVAGNYFFPSKAKLGDNIVTFVYQDPATKCKNSATIVVKVDDTSQIRIHPITSACAGDTIWLKADTFNVKNFSWSEASQVPDITAKFGDKTNPVTWFIPGIQNHLNGNFTVLASATARVSGSTCPVNPDQRTVKLFFKPKPNFEPKPSSGCAPLTVFFLNTTLGNVSSFAWDFGDGTKDSKNWNPTHTYENDGLSEKKFSVRLTVTTDKGCTKDTLMFECIRVLPKPRADFTATPTYTTITLPKIQFTNLTNPKQVTTRYEWDFGDGLGKSTEENPQYSYRDTGLFTVKLIARDNNSGCEDEKIAYGYINIRPEILVYIPNAFSPNRLFNDRTVRNEEFTVMASDYGSFEMTIFNRWGEELYHTTDRLKGWDGTYKNAPVQEGVYIYSVNITSLSGKKYKYSGSITLLR